MKENNLEKKLDKLIETFFKKNHRSFEEWKYNIKGKIYTEKELKDVIRKILEIDDKCDQCGEYFFKFELSKVGETQFKICQNCAELIMEGQLKPSFIENL